MQHQYAAAGHYLSKVQISEFCIVGILWYTEVLIYARHFVMC
jgi:hypothetical protein